MWKFRQENYIELEKLASVISPTTNEVLMASELRERWSALGLETETDVIGNVHATIGDVNADIRIGISAHIDHPAIQITNILPNGMLQFRSIGLTPHTLLGQPMKLLSKKGAIDCVVGFDPTSQYGQPKGLVFEDLWLDTGITQYDDVANIVSVGDLAVLCPRLSKTDTNKIIGTNIDNCIGLLVLNEVAHRAVDKRPDLALNIIATTQEESGLRGAQIVATNLKLDACFVLDVDYATDTPSSHPNQMGLLTLGSGVGLHVKADNNPVLRDLAILLADKNNIKYQVSVGRYNTGGTDASPFQLFGAKTAVLNLNIPCRYMHSPIETICTDDVESATNLLMALIDEISKEKLKSFRPGLD